jgi:hypothetical protein
MDILHSTRITLLLAFLALPLLLVSFTGFLAIGLGNMGLFILFIGQAILVPIVTELSNWIMRSRGWIKPEVSTDVSQLVPSASLMTYAQAAPSYWMAHLLFFLGYLLANSVNIYNLPVDSGASDWQVRNRKSKAVTVMTVVLLLIIILPLMRKLITGTETILGLALAFGLMLPLGYGWYQFASQCGARAADVFGIVQQIAPKSEDRPTTCVYTPKA